MYSEALMHGDTDVLEDPENDEDDKNSQKATKL